MHRYKKNGYVIESYLLGIMILSALMPLALSCVMVMMKSYRFDDMLQDEIAATQLRRIMNVSRDFQIHDDVLEFIYHDETYTLYQNGGRVLMKPGTQIVLDSVSDLLFSMNGSCIMMQYTREGKNFRKAIGYVQ